MVLVPRKWLRNRRIRRETVPLVIAAPTRQNSVPLLVESLLSTCPILVTPNKTVLSLMSEVVTHLNLAIMTRTSLPGASVPLHHLDQTLVAVALGVEAVV